MKSMIRKAGILLLLLFVSLGLHTPAVQAENTVVIHFFYDIACSNCALEGQLLTEIEETYSYVTVIRYEVTANDENDALAASVVARFQASPNDYGLLSGYPLTVVGGYAFTGYNAQTRANLEKLIYRYANREYVDIVGQLISSETVIDASFDTLAFQTGDLVSIPWFGTFQIEEISMGVAAFFIGIVDGFNPCAMWVLILLITLLANEKNRKKMWILGSVFLLTSGIVYFLLMVAWLEIAVSVTQIVWLRILIGAFAVTFGATNLLNYWKSRRQPEVGCEVTNVQQRKKILERVKTIVGQKNVWLAVIGIVGLAISANLIELACSAGLPFLYTQILAYNEISRVASIGYLLLYLFFFLLDDFIVFAIAMITLQVTGFTAKYAKVSHLVGGLLMIILGFLLIFFPNIIMFNF